jgi:hypothetical protein
MKTTIIVALSLACAGIASAQSPSAQTGNITNAPAASSSPVEIDSCSAGQTGDVLVSSTDGSFTVVFTNNGHGVADVVRFQIDLGSQRLFIRDAGTFTPGVTITHKFYNRGSNVVSSPILGGTRLRCTVASVHFADGTTWDPATAAAAAAAAGASPQPALPVTGDIGIMLDPAATVPTVKFVYPGGPAQLGGLTQGDVITSIDGQKVATTADVTTLIAASSVGTSIKVGVLRAGAAQTFAVTVRQKPAAMP